MMRIATTMISSEKKMLLAWRDEVLLSFPCSHLSALISLHSSLVPAFLSCSWLIDAYIHA